MPQQVIETLALPVGPTRAVAFLTSEEWLTDLADTFDVTLGDNRITVDTTRSIDVEVPPMARAFVSSPVIIRESRVWSSTGGAGTIDIVFIGLPVRAAGSLHCVDDPAGCRITIDVQVVADVPMFAAIAEQAVATEMHRIIAAEAAAAAARLAGRTDA